MSKSPRTPPPQEIDWPITILIAGIVVAAAVVVGVAFSNVMYP